MALVCSGIKKRIINSFGASSKSLPKLVAEQGDIRGGIVNLRALVFLQDGKYQCLEEEIATLKKRLDEVEANR